VKATQVTGLAAGQEYLRFFFNPVGTICRLYKQHGPVTALGRVGFKQPRDILLFAIGPEFNRLLFSDPSLFRPTGLILPGPRNSAQRRIRFGLTRMIGDQHRQQRQLVAPPFHHCAVRGYHDIMVDVMNSEIAEWKTGTGINIHAKVRALTLRVASAVLFSHDRAEAYPIGCMLEDWVHRCFSMGVWSFLPPVPYTVRVAQRPLKIGPLEVPPETRVIASHYLTHHLPDLYPEPQRFCPERWRTINPTQYEYLPFNAGPRICIGGAFATQVLKISLAMILQRFRFTVVPGTRINRIVAISMNPRHGLPMIMAKKDRNYSISVVRGQIREMVDFPANGVG
jgi:cytochrome P450